MSVAALQPSAVIYREEQYFDWRFYAVIGLIEAIVVVLVREWPNSALPDALWGQSIDRIIAIGLAAVSAIAIAVLKMTTEADPLAIRVWFGWFPVYRRLIPVASIKRVEVVSFRPLHDHGGWGVRWSRSGDRVLTARGHRGVRLELTDGAHVLIGSQRPEELALLLERTLRPGL